MDVTETNDQADKVESSEQRFPSKLAEDILFAGTKTHVDIGGRSIELKPLNLAGLKQTWNFIRDIARPFFAARVQYQRDCANYVAAREAEPNGFVEPPFPQWWMDPLEQCMDEFCVLVTAVLQRSDEGLTLDWVKRNMEPFGFLQDFVPAFIHQNHLDVFVKKLLASGLAAQIPGWTNTSASPTTSDSTESSPTSAGTTDSTTTN